jgi:hypothetical protein
LINLTVVSGNLFIFANIYWLILIFDICFPPLSVFSFVYFLKARQIQNHFLATQIRNSLCATQGRVG